MSRARRGQRRYAPARRPNVLTIVLDDTGFGQLGCFGSPIDTPSFDALAADGLRYTNMHTTALCSPSRSCILTGRNHHSNGMAAITELASGYPGYNGIIPFENGMLSEMLVAQGYNTYMVGKWHLTPSHRDGRRAVRPLAARRAASNASTGSSGATPASGIPSSSTTTTRSNRPARRRRATTSPRTSSTARSSSSPTPSRSTLTSRSTSTSASGPPTRRTTRRRSGPTGTPGSSTTGWDAYREQVFARQKSLGIVPADAELSRHDPDVPDWDSLPEPARRLFSRMMEVFAGFLSHTDHHLGRLLDFLRAEGKLDNTIVMVISDNGASAEGGPTGTTNEAQFFNNAQEPLEDSLAGHRRDRRPQALQPLSVGLDLGREHPVPALEAGDLPRRRVRPVHRLVAAGHHGQGRGPRAVRAHHRHGPHRAGPARHRAPRRDPRGDAVAAARRQLRGIPGRRRGRERPPHPVLRDAGPPGDLPRRLAGGLPVARAVVHRSRRRASVSRSRPRS